ncbi:hypothetical protein ACIPEN_05540 [Herbaspirillum chlorophenolicum]|uniref:Uncharacterized protein n=1 Tax=Herbaspirillum chlorophenolicum TaxID=211589 RepID=A0ABW8EVD4_9BURK
MGFANESGSDASVTKSGISGIAGDTAVRSDKDSSNALVKNWNAQELQADVEAQAKIMEAFGKQAALGIGTYATSKLNELNRKIDSETDPQKKEQLEAEAKNWAEGGAYRTALHAAAGALGGGLAGAAGATVSSVSMPMIADVIGKMDAPQAVKQALEQVAAAALGAAVGGTQGLASAVSVEANNRQLHQSEYDFAKKNAKLVAQKLKIGEQEAEGRIIAELLRNSDKQTADAAAGKHDYEIRSLIGCQNLNCDGYKTDAQYANANFNKQLITPNQQAYNAGQIQLGTGQSYNDLVMSNIKRDPVGATVAGAGMIGLGVLTGGGLPALGLAGTGATIGMGVNGGVQLVTNQPFDWFSFGMAGLTGASSSGMGFIPALLINTGGALSGSGIQGQNPNGAMAGAAIGTAAGFLFGAKIESGLGNVMNPWYRQQWKDIGLGMSIYIPKNSIPSWAGGIGSSIVQEKLGPIIQKKVEQ